MKTIRVYDIEAEAIEKICDANDMTTAEFMELLMEYAQDMVEDNNLN